MIVEILGPAGAGKTTLVTALCRTEPGIVTTVPITAIERASALWAALRPVLPYCVRHPRGDRFFSIEELRRMVYAGAWQRSLGRGDTDAGVTRLLDHGPVFMLAMLRAFGPPVTRSRAYGSWEALLLRSWAKLLDIVVCLDASDDTLVQRIEGRSRAHCLKGRPACEASEFLHRCRASFDRILAELERIGDLSVMRFRTDDTEPNALAEIVSGAIGLRARPLASPRGLRHAS